MTSYTIGNLLSQDDYSEDQIEAVLAALGIDIRSETENVFMTYCPFHRNVDSPSFAVSKTSGLYICFSPMCDVKGTLAKLVSQVAKLDVYQTRRFIAKLEGSKVPIAEQVNSIFDNKNTIKRFDQEIVNRLAEDLWDSPAQTYMLNRGYTDKTLAHFSIGYSKKKNLVTIPIHDWQGNSVGLIGRSITRKRYENSKKVPVSKTLFNIHRAKKVGDTVIIVESAMDALKIHQAGFPAVVATCGSFFTKNHIELVDRYFNSVIIMTDFDDAEEHIDKDCNKCIGGCKGHNPGRALGEKILRSLPNKRIHWAAYDYHVVFPEGIKDAGDMSEQQIRQCVNGAVTAAEYEYWKKDCARIGLI